MLMPRNYRPAVSAGTLDPRLPIKIRGGAGGGRREDGREASASKHGRFRIP